MSYVWKKNRVVIDSDSGIEGSEALDLSDNNKIDSHTIEDDSNSGLVDQSQDGFKNYDSDKKDSDNKPGKRNPKCARCANHEKEPVPVKGHKRKCKYKDCECRYCLLTVKRRELMAETIREKRKQKEDLADNTYIYNAPVFKKKRTDECLSETDRDSGYNTEDTEKNKLTDSLSLDELKQQMNLILGKLLEQNLSVGQIVESLLFNHFEDNMNSIVKQSPAERIKLITNRIIETSKQIPVTQTAFSPVSTNPFTPLTPTSPSCLMSPFMSPNSSNSSKRSTDSPNIFNSDRNYSLFANIHYPFQHPALMPGLGSKNQFSPMVINPITSVLNHQR